MAQPAEALYTAGSKSLEESLQRARRYLEEDHPLRLATLCKMCQSIFDTQFRDGEDQNHHPSPQALRAAAVAGCVICKRTWTAFHQRCVSDESQGFNCSVQRSGPWVSVLRMVYKGSTHSGALNQLLIVSLVQYFEDTPDSLRSKDSRDPDPNFYKRLKEVSSRTTNSPLSRDLCRYWLQTCRIEHEHRQQGMSLNKFRPTRLVHVEAKDGDIVDVRLECTKSGDPPVDYLSLSHCWGKAKFLTLRRHVYAQFQRAIIMDDLPNVFRDALTVTVQLGFSFIWIDSLCIVQDSEEDWLRESSLMKDIYQNCVLNIAATAFADGQGGLFAERQAFDLGWHKINCTWNGDRKRDNNAPTKGSYLIFNSDFFTTEIDNAPLNRRGWVQQERLLSPAVLHFGLKQLFWECQQSVSCELIPSGISDEDWYPARLGEGLLSKLRSQAQGCSNWHRIVEKYTAAELSQTGDKLLAIAGIAKHVRQGLQDHYLAGLWQSNFIEDLFWRCDGAVAREPGSIYRAPSWSWASQDSAVTYYSWQRQNLVSDPINARLQHINLDWRTDDDTGLLKYGSATMRGSLLRFEIANGRNEEGARLVFDSPINAMMWSLHYSLDFSECLYTSTVGQRSLSMVKDTRGAIRFAIRGCAVPGEQLVRSKPKFLLPLTADDCWELRGLILVSTGFERGQYMRIGSFHVALAPVDISILQGKSTVDWTGVTKEASDPLLAAEFWEENLGNGQYIFTIV